MKNIIYILLMVIPFFIKGQTLAKQSSVRVYEYFGFWSTGIIVCKYEAEEISFKDTISRYKVLSYIKPRDSSDYKLLDNRKYYFKIYPDSLVYRDQYPITIFNRSNIIDSNYSIDNRIYIKNKNKNDTIINNVTLKKTEVEITYQTLSGSSRPKKEIFIDRIGYTKEYILPWDYVDRQTDGGIGGRLLCYYDNVHGLVQFSDPNELVIGKPCSYWISHVNIDKIPKTNINYYVNNQKLLVSGDLINDLEIYDILGKRVIKERPLESQCEIDISVLPAGIYYMVINKNFTTSLNKVN